MATDETPMSDRDQAADWVARMDSGNWSQADEAALQAWLAADPRRQGLLLQTQAAWMLPDAVHEPDVVEAPEPANDTRGKWMRRGVLGGMVAASVAAFVTVRTGFSRDAEFVTRVGEIRRVPLDDGSILIPVDGRSRETAETLRVPPARLWRMLPDGQLDEAFSAATKDLAPGAGDIRVVDVAPDGRLLVLALWYGVPPQPYTWPWPVRNELHVLDRTGRKVASFNAPVF